MPGTFPTLPLASRQLNGPRFPDEVEPHLKCQIKTPLGGILEYKIPTGLPENEQLAAEAQLFRVVAFVIRDTYPGQPELFIQFIRQLTEAVREAKGQGNQPINFDMEPAP
ncbi:MAG: hypothetical protein JWL59_3547 [Chthoniobacteraceae bacterium]|nr:hypothetical protein [Chthoniobacteraceae bacterium]